MIPRIVGNWVSLATGYHWQLGIIGNLAGEMSRNLNLVS